MQENFKVIPEDIIKSPLYLTEKNTLLREKNVYVFEVAKNANKIQIREAVEKLFSVAVRKVNTLITRGSNKRVGRTYHQLRTVKKAMVTLAEGDSIDFFEGA